MHVSIAVLTCIAKDDDQKKLMGEVYRVLKPKGVLYMTDFLINEDQRNVDRYNASLEKLGIYGAFEHKEGVFLRHHSIDYINQITRDFDTNEFKTLVYTTMNKNKSNGFYFLGTKKGSGQ